MVAASAVVVSHAFPLSLGIGAAEPMESFAPFTLGSAAVQVFFAVSGFFIMKSFDRRSSLAEFTIARVARIMPGLAVVTLIVALLGAGGLSFSGNPYPRTTNGPLWTLWFEAVCYVALAACGLAGLYRNGRFPAFLAAFAVFYFLVLGRILPINPAYAHLGLPFVIGMSVYQYRNSVPLNGWLAASLALLAGWTGTQAAWSLALAYGALWLGSWDIPQLKLYNRLGDYSYGTYIYGWPVAQIIVLVSPAIGAYWLIALSTPASWALGVLSWKTVEQPAMSYARRLAARPADPLPA